MSCEDCFCVRSEAARTAEPHTIYIRRNIPSERCLDESQVGPWRFWCLWVYFPVLIRLWSFSLFSLVHRNPENFSWADIQLRMKNCLRGKCENDPLLRCFHGNYIKVRGEAFQKSGTVLASLLLEVCLGISTALSGTGRESAPMSLIYKWLFRKVCLFTEINAR